MDQPGTIRGCGREDSLLYHCIHAKGSAGSASACEALWFSDAIEQASFTTGCPKEEIETVWLSPNLGVDACGQRMTFAPSTSGWILNSTSEAPSSAAPSDEALSDEDGEAEDALP